MEVVFLKFYILTSSSDIKQCYIHQYKLIKHRGWIIQNSNLLPNNHISISLNMFWAIKRTVSKRRFFWIPITCVFVDRKENCLELPACRVYHSLADKVKSWRIFHAFLSSADFFQNHLFRKIILGIPSECQTVWIQIRPDILSGLIWVQTVCKCFSSQRTKLDATNIMILSLHYIKSSSGACWVILHVFFFLSSVVLYGSCISEGPYIVDIFFQCPSTLKLHSL